MSGTTLHNDATSKVRFRISKLINSYPPSSLNAFHSAPVILVSTESISSVTTNEELFTVAILLNGVTSAAVLVIPLSVIVTPVRTSVF